MVIIKGRKPKERENRQASPLEELFPEGNTRKESILVGSELHNEMLCITNNCRSLRGSFPKLRVQTSVEVPREHIRAYYKVYYPLPSVDERGKFLLSPERVITFRAQGQKRIGAIFFIARKTLIVSIGQYQGDLFHEFVKGWLLQHSFLSIRQPEDTPASASRTIVTVGCDPEFEIVHNSSVVAPPQGYKSQHTTAITTKIGLDGAGNQLELRPSPSTSEDEVCRELAFLMSRLNDPISTVGHAYPLGGHIHLGVGQPYYPHKDLIFLLDYFLGLPTLSASGSARGSYKSLGAWEQKNWGFEYRTPPAAVFQNPTICRIAMKIARNITEKYINEDEFVLNNCKYGFSVSNSGRPTEEEFRACTGLTADEYLQWQEELERINHLRNRRDCYTLNIAHFWNPAIQPTTMGKNPLCLEADFHTGQCQNLECQFCYPETYQQTIEIRKEKQRIYEKELQARRETERSRIVMLRLLEEKFLIRLSDQWSWEAERTILETLDKLDYKPGREISLFGLREDRGNVTLGYSFSGFDRLPDSPNEQNIYGLPYFLRVGKTPETRDELKAHIITIYQIELKYNQPVLDFEDREVTSCVL